MSTHRPTFDPTATPRPTTADPETPERPETAAPARDSWVGRCQTQFDARGTDRLHNLADEENWFAMRASEST